MPEDHNKSLWLTLVWLCCSTRRIHQLAFELSRYSRAIWNGVNPIWFTRWLSVLGILWTQFRKCEDCQTLLLLLKVYKIGENEIISHGNNYANLLDDINHCGLHHLTKHCFAVCHMYKIVNKKVKMWKNLL